MVEQGSESYLLGFQFLFERLVSRMDATEAVYTLLVDFANLFLFSDFIFLFTRQLHHISS